MKKTAHPHINFGFQCKEDFGKMTPVEKGRFCASCKKNVVDFSEFTSSESIDYIKKNKAVCGKMTANQLEQLNTHFALKQNKSFSVKSILASLSLTISSFIWGQNGTQIIFENENIKVFELATGINPDSLIENRIQAIVTDEDGEPIPFVRVFVPSMNQYKITDFDGAFNLHYGDSIHGNVHFRIDHYHQPDSSLVAQTLINKKVQIIMKNALEVKGLEMLGIIVVQPTRIQQFESKVRGYFDYRDKGRF
jgi:hypothetical protein